MLGSFISPVLRLTSDKSYSRVRPGNVPRFQGYQLNMRHSAWNWKLYMYYYTCCFHALTNTVVKETAPLWAAVAARSWGRHEVPDYINYYYDYYYYPEICDPGHPPSPTPSPTPPPPPPPCMFEITPLNVTEVEVTQMAYIISYRSRQLI